MSDYQHFGVDGGAGEQVTPEDPYQSEEYSKFVASMVQYCHCCEKNRPCDGVLAGGVCDGVKDTAFEDSMDSDDA